jgi:hypothetical protein
MKFNKHNILFFLCFTLILVTGIGIGYVYSVTSNSTFTISSGVYPNSVSYTIYKEGNIYYAKNVYGYLTYSSTDASYVTNSAINEACLTSNYAEIKWEIGDFYYTNPIKPKTGVTFRGSGYGTILILDNSADGKNLIENYNRTNGNAHIRIYDMTLDGNNAEITGTSNIIDFYRVRWYIINHCWIRNAETYGIKINGGNGRESVGEISGNYVYDCNQGNVYCYNTSDIRLTNNDIGGSTGGNAVYFYNSGS